MTRTDQVLRHAELTRDTPLTLYRLTARKYATTLSGLGAALSPGRWNGSGEEALYTSLHLSTCVLERLAHTPKDRIPSDLCVMTIHLSGRWTWHEPARLAEEEVTAAKWVSHTTLEAANQNWPPYGNLAQGEVAVLAVPSVIVPEWNVVLYPQAKGFWENVTLASIDPFSYDDRLFPKQDPPQP